jgi:glycosyltransferase involved in cell wall biosynthesis
VPVTKTVFLEPLWKLRGEYQDLARYPPEGYQFVVRHTWSEREAQRLSRFGLAYRILFALYKVAPMQLVKPYLQRFGRPPEGTDLTYAVLHPVFRREPWVLDMCGEQPHLLVGSETVFRGFRGILARTLASRYCRGVTCHVEIGKRALVNALGAPHLEGKVRVIYPAIPPRPFRKAYGQDGAVRLLFVGSSNIDTDWQFRDKGGLVLLEAFQTLREGFPRLELVIRSRVPTDVFAKYGSAPGIRIIQDVLPRREFDALFESADIFVCPAHLTPSVTFLQAMSYELPIVTTDVWSSPELVEDGRTGLLVHHPEAHRYIVDSIAHHDWPAFKEVVNRVHPGLVAGVIEKTRALIENPELRRRIGKEGRGEVEHGKFSIRQRNTELKRFLDEALHAEGMMVHADAP